MTHFRLFRAKSRNAGTESSRPFLDFARNERVWGAALIWFALTAAAPLTAIEAERAFAADAQRLGQWTAFRKWAAPQAILFVPQPVNAHEFLKNATDPQLSYQWWPAKAFVSCDGSMAVTTGPSVRGNYRGYFTTIWQRQPDGSWRWLLDHGDRLERPRLAGERTQVQRARCEAPFVSPLIGTKYKIEGGRSGAGQSRDGSLRWSWASGAKGERIISVSLASGPDRIGTRFDRVLHDEVVAP